MANLCHLYIFHEKSRSEFGEISPETPKNKKKTGEKTQNGYRVRALKLTT
jgi:hypothetical protein